MSHWAIIKEYQSQEYVTKIQCCIYHKISDPFTNVNCKSVKIWSKARNRSKGYEGKYEGESKSIRTGVLMFCGLAVLLSACAC